MSGARPTIHCRGAEDGDAAWRNEAAVAQARRQKWAAAVFFFSFLMAEAPYVIAGRADNSGGQGYAGNRLDHRSGDQCPMIDHRKKAPTPVICPCRSDPAGRDADDSGYCSAGLACRP